MKRAIVWGVACGVVLCGAWIPPAWAAPARLSAADARHLLGRAGFTPSPTEVAPWVGMSAEAAVDKLIGEASQAQPQHPPPAFTAEPVRTPPGRLPDDEARRAARQQARDDAAELAAWWIQEMRDTPTPLAERMVLFWHGHFATSMQKVQQAQGMFVQQQLFRRHAMGSFRELLHGVARDPAMLVYLDGAANRRQAPNENFAREVMELFTLGEGQYAESDVRDAARAFSGWAVERETWRASFNPRQHDGEAKTLFGRTAYFDADAALDAMLDQPAAARFLTIKLWREFVSPTPVPASVDRIAGRFREGWRIDGVLRDLLLSDEFWSKQARGALVKSPIDLAVGTLRQFDIPLLDARPLVAVTGRLGQALFYPPNVKGWPGHTRWIDSTRLLERKRFTERLLRTPEAGGDAGIMAEGGLRFAAGFDAEAWLRPLGMGPDRETDAPAQARLVAAMMARPPVTAPPAGAVGLACLRALSLDPAFQLK